MIRSPARKPSLPNCHKADGWRKRRRPQVAWAVFCHDWLYTAVRR